MLQLTTNTTVTQQGPSGTVTQQKTIDLIRSTESVELTTQRFDAPGKMVFETIEESEILLDNGAAVTFSEDGETQFTGFVFTAKRSKGGKVVYTAYDQLRYLKAKASYTFQNMDLPQIIRQIAGDFGLQVGELAETGYIFPVLVCENKECLGIIFDALSQTIVQTGKIFAFYDQAGRLVLREVKDMMVTSLLGNKSLVTDYTYTRDMASSTYNRVKLARPNKETGRADVYIHEDTDTIAKWGLLQYYDKVDENLNDAQIDELCKAYLQYYNRLLQTVTIEALGLRGLRAGNIVPVRITEVEELSKNRLLLAEKVTHKYEGEAHTMKVEVKNFEQLGGASWI